MRIAWMIFRAIMSAVLLLAVLVPVSLYVLLSLEPVQDRIRGIGESELSRLLGADVSIGKVHIRPFNKLNISDVALVLEGDTVAGLDEVSAGFELNHFLRTRELVFDYALIDGARFNICRETPEAPLNIQPIIDHLRKDKPTEEKPFDLRINTVVIRNASAVYNVISEPLTDPDRFCPGHIAVKDLELNAFIPEISNEKYRIHIDHLSFAERSGFRLDDLRAKAEFGRKGARLYDFSISLDDSYMALEPVELAYDGYREALSSLKRSRMTLKTGDGCYISPSDLRAFAPVLGGLDCRLAIALDAEGSLTDFRINSLSVSDNLLDAFSLSLAADITNILSPDSLEYSLDHLDATADGRSAAAALSPLLPAKTRSFLSRLPRYQISASGSGSLTGGHASLKASGAPGSVEFNGKYFLSRGARTCTIDGRLDTEQLNLRQLLGNPDLGLLTASVTGSGHIGGKTEADFKAKVSQFGFRGYEYTGIESSVRIERGSNAEVNISVNDPSATLLAYGIIKSEECGRHDINATATLGKVDLFALGLDKKHEGYLFGAKMNVEGSASDIDDISGTAELYDIRWTDKDNNGLKVSRISLAARPDDPSPALTIDSDIISGRIWGEYSFRTIGRQLTDLAAGFFPALFAGRSSGTAEEDKVKNNFRFEFTLPPSEQVTEFIGSPVHIMDDVEIEGFVDIRTGKANVNISAPYIRQGNKLFESTDIFASLDGPLNSSRLYATTRFGTKKGDMTVSALLEGADNRLDTHVDWLVERAIPINGTFVFSTLFRGTFGKGPDDTFPLDAMINFNPGTINFGDETWHIQTSSIDISPKQIIVDGFRLDGGSQTIAAEGTVGSDADDALALSLDKVNLLPIFETLEINNALLSGRASGVFSARNLLGSTPYLRCGNLHVDSIGYQRCTIGDADIDVAWDNGAKAFTLDADIRGLEGKKSRILGAIMPMSESLDIDFYADSIPVDFLKPFMVAFTSSITGRASGHARLFGTFHDINLEGDVFADNVKLKVDFTGTTYTATDSIRIRPGVINLDNITIRDPEGHTALLNGYVHHQCFHRPDFRFDITDANDFLSYNVSAKGNPDWYGTIYGNGSASIAGYPGVVNIGVKMATAPRSTFTFVLSDRLDAEDYSFLNFRDVTPDSIKSHREEPDNTPQAVRAFKSRTEAGSDEASTYNMDISVDIRKEAMLTLVMDPVAGDEIKAHGEGSLHMVYKSDNNDLNMWGKYILSDGTYRFTLQDIIIKDFTIKEGSEIKFDGDPYAAKTDLQAYYSTNANLSDLDESFLQDKEIARTNVPVHALMLVSGDIRQPSIDFDLEFPTLSSETYRKVRSIVSTSDMMNRQIIYLLALNRFYTPDYMTSTTRGSELFSVASSTISSQLGSMLGKLSDNWSIAPNLRSDRGDFSDVEVDVALSSRLLNNRLIFNGNFGYRDKELNSNQFIGDFDIEYLLNQRGSWRLKAYNRYNDRNYYIRSAQTTQGIGVVFRRDFDRLFSFLRRKKKTVEKSDSASASGHMPVVRKQEQPDSTATRNSTESEK